MAERLCITCDEILQPSQKLMCKRCVRAYESRPCPPPFEDNVSASLRWVSERLRRFNERKARLLKRLPRKR